MSRYAVLVVSFVAVAGWLDLPRCHTITANASDDLPLGVFCRVEMRDHIVRKGVACKTTDQWLVLERTNGKGEFWVRHENIIQITTFPDRTPRKPSDPTAVLVQPGEDVVVHVRRAGISVRATARSRDAGSKGDTVRAEGMFNGNAHYEARVVGPREVTVMTWPERASDRQAARSRPRRQRTRQSSGQIRLIDICRLKGPEDVSLHGEGIVFIKDSKITLVLDRDHAEFRVAQNVADAINDHVKPGADGTAPAHALDQANIVVNVPVACQETPVMFVADVLDLRINVPKMCPRAVINERAGSIMISGEVEIASGIVVHKNVVVEIGSVATANPTQDSMAKLKELVDALTAVQVPPEDMIDIIKGLDRNGKLYGWLVIE